MPDTDEPPTTGRGSETIREAAQSWLQDAESGGLELSTVNGYRRIVVREIVTPVGKVRLAKLSRCMLVDFQANLRGLVSKDRAKLVDSPAVRPSAPVR